MTCPPEKRMFNNEYLITTIINKIYTWPNFAIKLCRRLGQYHGCRQTLVSEGANT